VHRVTGNHPKDQNWILTKVTTIAFLVCLPRSHHYPCPFFSCIIIWALFVYIYYAGIFLEDPLYIVLALYSSPPPQVYTSLATCMTWESCTLIW
jgi:hypothetical protein